MEVTYDKCVELQNWWAAKYNFGMRKGALDTIKPSGLVSAVVKRDHDAKLEKEENARAVKAHERQERARRCAAQSAGGGRGRGGAISTGSHPVSEVESP
jgi:hypothetical protein